MKSMKKAVSLLLALVMCLGMLPMSSFAADVPEHEHNQNGWQCVYTEPVTETACTHQHDGTCGYAAPAEGSPCTHVHDEDCGYAAAVEGAACTCGAQPDENGVVTHAGDCAYAEAKAEVPCNHQHDEACGYVEAKAEVPCAHECGEACAKVVTEGYWTCAAPAAEEVPAQVQAFLDAVAALPAPETVTKDNAEAVGAQVNAVLDMYEGLIDADLDGREDVAGALPTVYAVYEAVLAAEEIPDSTTFEASGDSLFGREYHIYDQTVVYELNRQTLNLNIKVGVGETWVDEGVFRFNNGYDIYEPNWGYGSSAFNIWSTNTNVLRVTAVTSGNSVRITYEGIADGTAQIMMGFNCSTLSTGTIGTVGAGLSGGASCANCTVGTATVGTGSGGSGGGTTEPSAPSAPSLDEMGDIQVMVSCVKANGSTNSSCYNMTRDLTAYPNNYTIGDVVKNPGTKYSSSSYPYMCTITLNNEAWKDTFATILKQQTGITRPHYVHTKTGTVTKDFYYSASKNVWYYENPSTMYVYVTETAPAPAPTTYKIVHEYYINDEYIAGVTGSGNGTVGQKLVGQTIADENPGWVNREVDRVQHTFTYAGSYEGSYDGNKLTVGAKADSVTLTANTSTNVIVLRYEENISQIKSIVKELVKSANAVPAGLTASDYTYPDSTGKVHIPYGGTVTLMYKITVTGDAGAKYKVTDEGATRVGGDPMEGAIPTGGSAVIYVTKTFSASNINNQGALENTATVTPGKGSESSTSYTETTPAEEDALVDNGNGIKVTKTRTAINGDASKTTAKVGDKITWSITVTNLSNVTKTVTLTELDDVSLSKNSVTLEAGGSETVTATYVVQAADAGKTFTNAVKAEVPGSTNSKDKDEDTDEGTTITPEQYNVTVKYVTDNGVELGKITYTLAGNGTYNHSVGNGTTVPTTGDANTESPKTITGTDGKTYAYDPVLTTNALTGTMGSTDVTITVVYSLDEKGTIGTDPDGDPTDTPDGIPDKYQVKVTFEVKNGAWDNTTTDDVVKYLVKYAADGETYAENGTAALGNIIPAVGNEPDQGFKAGDWDNEPTVATTITEDTTYTYTYVLDTTADGGIEVTKKLAKGQKPDVSVGDTVQWDIVVKNNSAESKTVKLTELLVGATLSEAAVTLAKGESKTVNATYKVTASDAGKKLTNSVFVETGDEKDVVTSDDTVKIVKLKLVKTNVVEKIDSRTQVVHYTIKMTNESEFPVYDLDLYSDVLTATVTDPNSTAADKRVNTATITFGSTAMVDGTEFTTEGNSNVTFNDGSKNVHKWMRVDDVMSPGETVTLTYDVTIKNTGRTALKVIMNNTASCGAWIEDQDAADEGGVVAQAEYTVEAPRFMSLANMFGYSGTADGGSNVGGGDGGTSGGGDTTPPEESDNNQTTDSGSSDAEIDFGVPDDIDDGSGDQGGGNQGGGNQGGGNQGGGNQGGNDQGGGSLDPVAPYEPYDPNPVTPVNPPEVEIDDERTPLASANGLNSVDHFAYIIGYDDDTVRPENKITRAEVATIFFRLMTDVYRAANWSTTNDFSDVAAGSWYNNAISTCAKAGLVNGYSDGAFKPDQSITRAEFATIAARFLDEEITGAGAEGFADIEGHWAETNILRAAEAGWVNGDNGRFRPDDYISRAEVMTIVNRMLNRVPDEDHLLPEMKTWSDNPKTAWYYEAVQEATNEHAYEWIDENVENWTELLTIRDWAALEKEWATAYSAGN